MFGFEVFYPKTFEESYYTCILDSTTGKLPDIATTVSKQRPVHWKMEAFILEWQIYVAN